MIQSTSLKNLNPFNHFHTDPNKTNNLTESKSRNEDNFLENNIFEIIKIDIKEILVVKQLFDFCFRVLPILTSLSHS